MAHSFQQLQEIIARSFKLLIKNDAFLLEKAANERSITHKLAEYIQLFLPEYNVDCEYNRHGIETKKLPRVCQEGPKVNVFPDIVVHIRNTDEYNLLVIEAKLQSTTIVPECDDVKLVEFTKESGDYKYDLGLFISFNGINNPQLVWYKNGRQASSD